MSDQDSILFYTCANRPYHDFAPLYACSVLLNVPSSIVEIGVEGDFNFEAVHGGATEILWEIFGRDRFEYHGVDWFQESGAKVNPNTVRFITTPKNKARYIYIGDIDIIFLDHTFPADHMKFMRKTGLPYSNSVRPNTRRLSGLHFTEYDAYYPLPELSGIDLAHTNDEEVLCKVCERKGLEIQNKEWFRPSHGIHISPNRSIRGSGGAPGWNVESRLPAYQKLVASDAMRALRPYLSERIRGFLEQIEQDYGISPAT